jgi:hypothetical protein
VPGSRFVTCLPPDQGWDREKDANKDGCGKYIRFYHAGGPIGIVFADDPVYTDNCSHTEGCGDPKCGRCGNMVFGGPTFVYPCPFTAGTICGRISNSSGSWKYEMDFTFDSYCEYTGIDVTLVDHTGGSHISWAETKTIDVALGTNTVTLQFLLTDESHKCFGAYLSFSGGHDPSGTGVANPCDVGYDFTPNFSVDVGGVAEFCLGFFPSGDCPNFGDYTDAQNVQFLLTYVSGLPCLKLDGSCDVTMTLAGTGISQIGSSAPRGTDCPTPPAHGHNGPTCEAGGDADMFFTCTGTPSSVNVTAAWMVGGCTLPPTTHTLSLSWAGTCHP